MPPPGAVEQPLVLVPDRGRLTRLVHPPHDRGRLLDVGVERVELQDRFQNGRHAMPVGADQPLDIGHRREIGIGDHQLVTVPHLGDQVQELGREDARNAL